MTEKLKLIILKALLFGYAEITRDTTNEESKDEAFYKQALEICKFFKNKKPEMLPKADRVLLDSVYRKFVAYDAEFFDNNLGSPYLCMLCLLDYLVNEKNDLLLKSKFGHYDFPRMRKELDYSYSLSVPYRNANGYVTNIINKLNIDDVIRCENKSVNVRIKKRG
jgi:hypothetical protein